MFSATKPITDLRNIIKHSETSETRKNFNESLLGVAFDVYFCIIWISEYFSLKTNFELIGT